MFQGPWAMAQRRTGLEIKDRACLSILNKVDRLLTRACMDDCMLRVKEHDSLRRDQNIVPR